MEDAVGMETDMTLKGNARTRVEVSNRCVLLKCESHMLLNFKMSWIFAYNGEAPLSVRVLALELSPILTMG